MRNIRIYFVFFTISCFVLASDLKAGPPSMMGSPMMSRPVTAQHPQHTAPQSTFISRTTKYPASVADAGGRKLENKVHEGRTQTKSHINMSLMGNTVHRTFKNPDGSKTKEIHHHR